MMLIIVTCPQLASQRLSKQIAQMNRAIELGLITSLHIICMGDLEAQRLSETRYIPDRWSTDIAIGWEFFKGNITAQSHYNNLSDEDCMKLLSRDTCFPSRQLTESEHSVAFRHIVAIKYISCAGSPCLVLEDDALVCDEMLFHELLDSFTQYSKKRLFFDLCDSYIPIGDVNHSSLLIGRLKYCVRPTAITRTLMAYAMFPETADLLINSFTHYSLPIDMQLQVLLSKLCIPGLSIFNSPFSHGSKTNAMSSSVRKF
jgi:hypothetical protein